MKAIPLKYLIALFAVSLAYTFLINTLNVHAIKKYYPGAVDVNSRSLVYGYTVYSVDNYWYVNQVKNWMQHGVFTVDITKPKYEVRRTPVYPLFYGAHYFLFGEENSYRWIRFTQAFLLALAVVALCLAMYNITGNKHIAFLSAILYGAFPAVAVSTYYTITESLSSELVCFCLYFLSLAKVKSEKKYWFFAGLFFALGALCRPTIVFLALSACVALWVYSSSLKKSVIHGIYFAIGALLLFLPWTIRNYRITGDVIFLEKFYGDPMDYGMPNIHLREWISCWTNPADFTSEMVSNAMRTNIYNKEVQPRDSLIGGFLAQMPARAFTGNSKEKVQRAFASMYDFYLQRMSGDTTGVFYKEQQASSYFIALRDNFKRTAPMQYYLARPLIFFKSLAFHSNSTSLAFLDQYEASAVKKIIKGVLLLISVFSWLSVFLLLFWYKRYRDFSWMALLFIAASLAISIGVLSYYEARYNFPLFPVLFGAMSIVMVELIALLRVKFLRFEK